MEKIGHILIPLSSSIYKSPNYTATTPPQSYISRSRIREIIIIFFINVHIVDDIVRNVIWHLFIWFRNNKLQKGGEWVYTFRVGASVDWCYLAVYYQDINVFEVLKMGNESTATNKHLILYLLYNIEHQKINYIYVFPFSFLLFPIFFIRCCVFFSLLHKLKFEWVCSMGNIRE